MYAPAGLCIHGNPATKPCAACATHARSVQKVAGDTIDDPRATYRTRREAVAALDMLAGWPDAHPQRIDAGAHHRPYWVLCVSHGLGTDWQHVYSRHLYKDGYVR